MFIHLIKDYQKKLEDLTDRLNAAKDDAERRSLGLKLKFYANEVGHYMKMVGGLNARVEALKLAYGFDWGEPAADEKSESAEMEVAAPAEEMAPADGDGEGEADGAPAEAMAANGPAGPAEVESEGDGESAEGEKDAPGQGDGEPLATERRAEKAAPAKQVFPYSFVFEVIDWANRSGKHCGGAMVDIVESLSDEDRRRLSLALELEDPVGQLIHDGVPPELEGHLNVILALFARTQGQKEYELRFAEAGVETGINSPALLYLLGSQALEKGDVRAASMHFVSAVLKDETFGRARLALASAYKMQSRRDKILDVLPADGFASERLLAEAALMRAEALFELGRGDSALAELDGICDGGSALAGRGLCLRGKILAGRNQPLEATEALEKAYELMPEDDEVNFELGCLYWRHNATALGRRHLEGLVKRRPDSDFAARARRLMNGGQ